jgi:hypothetical protein
MSGGGTPKKPQKRASLLYRSLEEFMVASVLNPSGVLEMSALRQKPTSKHPTSVIILAGALVDGIRNLQLLYCRGRRIILT